MTESGKVAIDKGQTILVLFGTCCVRIRCCKRVKLHLKRTLTAGKRDNRHEEKERHKQEKDSEYMKMSQKRKVLLLIEHKY